MIISIYINFHKNIFTKRFKNSNLRKNIFNYLDLINIIIGLVDSDKLLETLDLF